MAIELINYHDDSAYSALRPVESTEKHLQYVSLIQKLNQELLSGDDRRQHKLSKKVSSSYFSQVLRILQQFNDSISTLGAQFDYVLENQRGMKLFGIPFFSNNSLLPMIDPLNYQSINGVSLRLSENKLDNFPLPDLDWAWSWDSWYILMFNDVDDEGWIYSNIVFNKSISDRRWKGKYYFGNFVRRRVWVRMRERSGDLNDEYMKSLTEGQSTDT